MKRGRVRVRVWVPSQLRGGRRSGCAGLIQVADHLRRLPRTLVRNVFFLVIARDEEQGGIARHVIARGDFMSGGIHGSDHNPCVIFEMCRNFSVLGLQGFAMTAPRGVELH